MPKARAKDIPEGPHRFTEREFEPYSLAIGQFCLAWNDLHERLGMLFSMLCAGKHYQSRRWTKATVGNYSRYINSFSVHAAIWHSGHYDRPKRDMLRAAVENVRLVEKFPKLEESIRDLLKHATTLEDTRNIVVHTPLQWGPPYMEDQPRARPGVRPNLFLGNQKAQRLSKISFTKKILDEISWAHAAVLACRDHAVSIEAALVSGDASAWPGKLQLPNRGHGQAAKSQRVAAPLPPPPRSSRQ
jgi:hypothetical protein